MSVYDYAEIKGSPEPIPGHIENLIILERDMKIRLEAGDQLRINGHLWTVTQVRCGQESIWGPRTDVTLQYQVNG